MKEKYSFDTDGINKYVNRYVQSLGDLKGKKVLDCPAGDGRTSYQFLEKGAEVVSGDLFPQFFKLKETQCKEIDLMEGLPFDDESFDLAICQEGLEHMPNQLFVLKEFARVLKKEGTLILTVPNISQLRCKFSFFFNESDSYKRAAPNELDSVWFSESKKDKLYFGHVFLISIQKLRTLSLFSGLKLEKYYQTDIGGTSLVLFFLFYPFILFFNLMPFIFYLKKLKNIKKELKLKMLKEQFRLNCSPKILTSKHLFLVLKKEYDKDEVIDTLKSYTR